MDWLTTLFGVESILTQTSQRAVAEIQFFNAAQLSHVQRQGKPGVVGQLHVNAPCLHLDYRKRKFSCNRHPKSIENSDIKEDGELVEPFYLMGKNEMTLTGQLVSLKI